MSRSATMLAYKESRYVEGKRVDPAASHEERLKKQLAAKVRTLRESSIAGVWFDSWYAAQVAKKVDPPPPGGERGIFLDG